MAPSPAQRCGALQAPLLKVTVDLRERARPFGSPTRAGSCVGSDPLAAVEPCRATEGALFMLADDWWGPSFLVSGRPPTRLTRSASSPTGTLPSVRRSPFCSLQKDNAIPPRAHMLSLNTLPLYAASRRALFAGRQYPDRYVLATLSLANGLLREKLLAVGRLPVRPH